MGKVRSPALDGLRAVAVLAVFFFHANWGPFDGGFLGVEIFFVISGYLITSLLVAEHDRHGQISIKQFWQKRAKRLLPALLLVLIGTCALALLVARDSLATLKSDLLAAATYSSNWWFIFKDHNYFESLERPPLLEHLWSLAIEEQFYLLWPIVVVAGLRLWTKRNFAIWLGACALLSAVVMAVVYDPLDVSSRAYFGTDTRASGLLVGSAVALVFPLSKAKRANRKADHRAISVVGAASLVGLAALIVVVDASSSWLFTGGFLLVDVMTIGVIIAITHHASWLGKPLATKPMVWLGERSYGIYLWHWPIIATTRAGIDVALGGLPLVLLQGTATLGVAAASYRFVEMPVRSGSLGKTWRALKAGKGKRYDQAKRRTQQVAIPFAAACIAVSIGIVVVKPAVDTGGLDPAVVAAMQEVRDPSLPTVNTSIPGAGTRTASGASDVAQLSASAPVADLANPGQSTNAPAVLAVGDSVMLSASPAMYATIPNVTVDAVTGRQFSDGIAVLQWYRDNGYWHDKLIVGLGTNGTFSPSQFHQIMEIAAGRPIAFINTNVPREWEAETNQRMGESVAMYPNARLVDWKTYCNPYPEFFAVDGYHLSPAGGSAYAMLTFNKLAS